MKLSDAILLGSSTHKLEPMVWQNQECGCLIGLGLHAVGHVPSEYQSENKDAATEAYPWLNNAFTPPVYVAKDPLSNFSDWNASFGVDVLLGQMLAWQIITVMAYLVRRNELSMEAAIEWIRSVEPEETTEAELQSEWKQELVEMST